MKLRLSFPEQAYLEERARRTHAPRLPAPRMGWSRAGNGPVATNLGPRLLPDGIRVKLVNVLETPAHDKTSSSSKAGCRLVLGAAGPSDQLGSLA